MRAKQYAGSCLLSSSKAVSLKYLFIFLLFGLMFTSTAFARDFVFTWTANAEPVDGYKLYYKVGDGNPPFDGIGALEGDSPIAIGKITAFTLRGLPTTGVYYFAVTAYHGNEESAYSTIITHLPPPLVTIVTPR